ncbi:MAG: hypothetical protein DI551_03825 [Micavibrio aeruginosavorus]|uniref:Uncharacterized protein n=1 Tax=Micavibrio aeruginosavorus TaxID=349221 RepID=A0A2W5N1D7_9BACT|nr:MAG: hypothetical protein DI551_03825 [Micavibrio aeruginosavorus]
MKQTIQKHLVWAVILSETSHVFCCVFPTIFSVLSLFAGLGLVATMPTFMVTMHGILHAWELPMIAFSGLVLAIGWGAVWYGDRMDCHNTGCCHGACAPQKKRAHTILKLATVLFLFNVLIYFAVHKSTWFATHIGASMGQGVAHSHDHAE